MYVCAKKKIERNREETVKYAKSCKFGNIIKESLKTQNQLISNQKDTYSGIKLQPQECLRDNGSNCSYGTNEKITLEDIRNRTIERFRAFHDIYTDVLRLSIIK